MLNTTIFGHWEGTFIITNAILLKTVFYFLNIFPAIAAQGGILLSVLVCLIYLVIILIIRLILSKTQGGDLLEMCREVGGQPLMIVVGLICMGCFFLNTGISISLCVQALKNILLPTTPFAIMVILMVLACYYLANKGIEAIARAHGFFVPIAIGVTVIITIFMMSIGNAGNLFPYLGKGLPSILGGALTGLSGFFEIIFLFFLIPNLKKTEVIKKTCGKAFLIPAVGLIYLTFVYMYSFPYPGNTSNMAVIMMITENMTFHAPYRQILSLSPIIYVVCTMLYVTLNLYFINQIFARLFRIEKTVPSLVLNAIVIAGISIGATGDILNKQIYEYNLKYFWITGLLLPVVILFLYYLKKRGSRV